MHRFMIQTDFLKTCFQQDELFIIIYLFIYFTIVPLQQKINLEADCKQNNLEKY